MQTILGSGGSIGVPLARELSRYTNSIRLVSRHPKKINPTDELFPLDVNDLAGIDKAIRGSEVVYVTIGFEYNINVWRKVWPPFLQQVINSCREHKARLVFFDNIYMYAASSLSNMTEEAPIDPPSKKGVIRKQLQDMIMTAVANNEITALIARAADFYGPETDKSMLAETAVKNFLKGKKAQAFGNINKVHTYTYTPDAAKATALLGNTPGAYGQVWHLPTTHQRLTTREWIEMIAAELKVAPRIQMIPTWLLKMIGLFNPLLREFPEMLYQNERDYVFNSKKFEDRFGIAATDPREGIRAMIAYLREKR
jgi:nucleoside-diphosphate-sugar epimerase